MNVEQELDVLKRQVQRLRQQVQQQGELLEVLATPIHRKLWFWVCGYRITRVGRWWPSAKYPDLH
jgi:hypothetical protein